MSARRPTSDAGEPLFDFILAPVEACPVDAANLSWYWLSFGSFWIQTGRHQLFRYTPSILRHWGQPASPPWDACQVAGRLSSEVLDQLPAVLRPIPDELDRYVGTMAAHRRWREMCRRWRSRPAPRGRNRDDWTLELGDVSHTALRWTGERSVGMPGLRFGHDIEVFRRDDTITIRWFGAGTRHRNIKVWTAPESGEIRMPVGHYLREVRSAHKRLLAAMAKRPAEFRRQGLPLDAEQCQNARASFRTEYDAALQLAERYTPDYPWHKVLAACEQIERWATRPNARPRAANHRPPHPAAPSTPTSK